jgi:hypothetical protein
MRCPIGFLKCCPTQPVHYRDRVGDDVADGHAGVMASQLGAQLVRVHQVLTAVFVLTALYAAAVFDTAAQWAGAITAMVLFSIGVVLFLWGFWNAVQRSRTEELAVTSVFFLTGGCASSQVRRQMNLMLIVQVVTAFATTFWRSTGPDGNPGSSLALGILVPMLGLGLNGLWASMYGTFGARITHSSRPSPTGEAE